MGTVAIILCFICVSVVILIVEKEISKLNRKWGENY